MIIDYQKSSPTIRYVHVSLTAWGFLQVEQKRSTQIEMALSVCRLLVAATKTLFLVQPFLFARCKAGWASKQADLYLHEVSE